MYERSVRCTVLIVGAGPTGLTLACDLQRRGVSFRLIDAAAQPFSGSRGKGLQPRTLEVFDDLGVIDEVQRAGANYPKFRVHAGPLSLRGWSLGTRRAPSESVPYPNLWMVPQWRTEEILRQRLRALGGDVEQGVTLTTLRQGGDERESAAAHANTNDGAAASANANERAAANANANNGAATNNSANNGAATNTNASNGAATNTNAGNNNDGDGVTVTLTSTGTAGAAQLVRADYVVGCDGGHSVVRKTLGEQLLGEALPSQPRLVGDIEVSGLGREDWHLWPLAKGGLLALCPLPGTRQFQLMAPAATPDCIDRIERTVYDATGHRVERVAWSSIYRPQVRMVRRYRVGRVLLAGDAAHVHPPTGGQGLNTGVQDAYNLGWKLAAVSRGAPAALLDSYEAERLPIAAAVLGLSKRLYQSRSIRRGDATNQLALHYRSSALSSGMPLGKLHPGDRMPDARLPDGTRLFDRLRGPHATLLVTKAGARVLIRPDGYIASIGRDDVAEYYGEAPHVVHVA